MKILENKGIETTGLSASAINKLITAGKSGIVGGYLNECALSTTGNTVIISTGKMIIGGVQLEIDTPVSLNLSSVPTEDVRYQVVVELRKGEDEQWVDDIFVRLPSTLIQENFTQGGYTYQLELGRVTHKTTGQVTEALRTADILYGQSGAGADIEVGEVNTQMISTELPAEVNINKTVDGGKTKLNFDFSLPKPYEDSVTGLVYSTQIVGNPVNIPNTNDGFIDEITLEGNTIGGGGTPETPIAIQSVESPISLVNCGKNICSLGDCLASYNTSYVKNSDNQITITSTKSANNIKKYTAMKLGNIPQGKYYLSFGKSGNCENIIIYAQNALNTGNPIGGGVNAIAIKSFPSNGTLTIPSGYVAFYALFYLKADTALGDTGVFSNLQLEKGSTATEYEPYQGTTLSIPIKDTNGNALKLRRVGTAYDSVYKENGKWYLRKAINEQVLNGSENWKVTADRFFIGKPDAKMPVNEGTLANLIATTHQTVTLNQVLSSGANGAYLAYNNFGIRDSVTFAGFTVADLKTWLSTHNITIAYELATPEIIELHEDTATALESIKTFQGQTNIFGTNTVNPILDITELAMGIGEKKYALLTDGDGNAVMPVNEADNVLMRDGKTVQYHLDKGVIYDQVIRTQTDFEALIASPTWLDAKSVALVGQFVYDEPDNSGIKIPATVKQIHGFNSAKITITNFVYNATTAKGGLWYNTRPTTLDYSIRDLEVDCTGAGTDAIGFYSCTNLTNCTGTGTGTANGYGFGNCTNLTNCTGTGTGAETNGYGFSYCTNLTNCTGTGEGTNGFGFSNCTNLTNCTGTGTGGILNGWGFYYINYASNCRDGGSSTAMWGGTNKNINVETCRKTLVNADNATLNT